MIYFRERKKKANPLDAFGEVDLYIFQAIEFRKQGGQSSTWGEKMIKVRKSMQLPMVIFFGVYWLINLGVYWIIFPFMLLFNDLADPTAHLSELLIGWMVEYQVAHFGRIFLVFLIVVGIGTAINLSITKTREEQLKMWLAQPLQKQDSSEEEE